MKQSIMKGSALDKELQAIVRKEKNLKPTKKETTTMKTSSKKTVILTVLTTLFVPAAVVAQAVYFYQLGADTQKAENNRVRAEVAKQLAELKPHAQ